MLDLGYMEDCVPTPRTKSTQVRHDEELGEGIEKASACLGVDKSVFLRAIIKREVTRVLEAQTRHVMTPQDAELFAAALDTPPQATDRALRAAKAYRKRVVHAD